MASNNGNDNSSQTPDTVVCDNLNTIRTEQESARSKKKAAGKSRNSKESSRGYKICCIDRAEETHNIYQDLMSCVAIGHYKKSEIIQARIDDYIKKDGDIEKLIAESSKLINELCTKVVEANSELCTMTTCIKDIVDPDSKKKNISPKDKKSAEEILECLTEITEKTTDLKNKAENAVESVITIAGIQTFTNTESLKDFAANFAAKVKEFKECTDKYIKSTDEELNTAREELNKIMEELAIVECDEAAENTTIKGLQEVIDFICKCDCKGECLDLCAEFEKCCEDPKEEGKKQPKNRVDQN